MGQSTLLDLTKADESIFDEAKEKKVFKNKDYLRTDSIPEQILHRNVEMNKMFRSAFEPPVNNYAGNHITIAGPPGTGKTLCTLRLRDLAISRLKKDGRRDTRFVYVNCSRKSSSAYVLRAILGELKIQFRKDNDVDFYLTQLFKEIDESYKYVIIILDEVDKLLPKSAKDTDSLLYSLLRARELRELKHTWVTLYLISNDARLKEKLSPGTQSSLGGNWLNFENYTEDQLFEILKDRAEKAFNEECYDEEFLRKVAYYVVETGIGGDARRAIELLKLTGEMAEHNKAKKLSLSHFEEAKTRYEAQQLENEIISQPWHSQMCLLLFTTLYLKNEKAVKVSKVINGYRKICEACRIDPVTDRHIYNYLDDYSSKGWADFYVENGIKIYSLSILKEGITYTHKLLMDIYEKRVEKSKKMKEVKDDQA